VSGGGSITPRSMWKNSGRSTKACSTFIPWLSLNRSHAFTL
jgi:hypothetical protein